MVKTPTFSSHSLIKTVFVALLIASMAFAAKLYAKTPSAEQPVPSSDRFQIIATSKGLLRLDKATGRVESCKIQDKLLNCQPLVMQNLDATINKRDIESGSTTVRKKTPSDTAQQPVTKHQEQVKPKIEGRAPNTDATPNNSSALSQENQKLKNRITELKQKLADLENENILLGDPNSGIKGKRNPKMTLPTDEEVDAAIGYVQKLLKKFRGAAEKFKEELEKPQTPPQEEDREL